MKQRKIERLLENLLTIDDGLVLLLCVPAQLDLHKWTGDAAAWLRKVPGTNHLQGTNTTALILCTQSGPKCIFVHKWTLNVTHNHDRGTESVCARVAAHLDHNFVFDFLLVLMRVVAIHTHELRLQHVARLSVQTEEGVVQLHVFIWVDTRIWITSQCHFSFRQILIIF